VRTFWPVASRAQESPGWSMVAFGSTPSGDWLNPSPVTKVLNPDEPRAGYTGREHFTAQSRKLHRGDRI